MTVQPMVKRHRQPDPMLGNGTNLPAQIFCRDWIEVLIQIFTESMKQFVMVSSVKVWRYQIRVMVFMILSCFLSQHVRPPLEMLGNSCEQICPILYSYLRLRLHVPSTSQLFVPFKIGFNAEIQYCLHITWKRSKIPLTKIVILTVRVNEPLASSNCEYERFKRSLNNLSLDFLAR